MASLYWLLPNCLPKKLMLGLHQLEGIHMKILLIFARNSQVCHSLFMVLALLRNWMECSLHSLIIGFRACSEVGVSGILIEDSFLHFIRL